VSQIFKAVIRKECFPSARKEQFSFPAKDQVKLQMLRGSAHARILIMMASRTMLTKSVSEVFMLQAVSAVIGFKSTEFADFLSPFFRANLAWAPLQVIFEEEVDRQPPPHIQEAKHQEYCITARSVYPVPMHGFEFRAY
jgi:hypothetical protein